MNYKDIYPIKLEKVKSGQHAGWYHASINGSGNYGTTPEVAIRTLRVVLECGNEYSEGTIKEIFKRYDSQTKS